MDDGAAIVEGTEACQGELTIEDGSVSNGTIDADGAQSHGAERVSDAQGAQLVGRHLTSMVSGGIAGADSGAAAVTPTKKKRNKSKRGGVKSKMTRHEWKKWQRDHGQG